MIVVWSRWIGTSLREPCHAELVQGHRGGRNCRGIGLCGHVPPGQFRRSQNARNERHGAAGTLRQAPAVTVMGAHKAPAPRLVELFLDMLASERGGAANTLEAYTRDLDDLTAFLAGKRRTVATAATSDLRAYLGDLAARGFKPASVARRLSAIRQLYRFLYAEGHRSDDPAAILEGPKRSRPLPKVLTVGDVDRLIADARAAAEASEAPVLERL